MVTGSQCTDELFLVEGGRSKTIVYNALLSAAQPPVLLTTDYCQEIAASSADDIQVKFL